MNKSAKDDVSDMSEKLHSLRLSSFSPPVSPFQSSFPPAHNYNVNNIYNMDNLPTQTNDTNTNTNTARLPSPSFLFEGEKIIQEGVDGVCTELYDDDAVRNILQKLDDFNTTNLAANKIIIFSTDVLYALQNVQKYLLHNYNYIYNNNNNNNISSSPPGNAFLHSRVSSSSSSFLHLSSFSSSCDDEYIADETLKNLRMSLSKHLVDMQCNKWKAPKIIDRTSSVGWPVIILKLYQILCDLIHINSYNEDEHDKKNNNKNNILLSPPTYTLPTDKNDGYREGVEEGYNNKNEENKTTKSNEKNASINNDDTYEQSTTITHTGRSASNVSSDETEKAMEDMYEYNNNKEKEKEGEKKKQVYVHRQTNIWETLSLYEILQKVNVYTGGSEGRGLSRDMSMCIDHNKSYDNLSSQNSATFGTNNANANNNAENDGSNKHKMGVKVHIILKSGAWRDFNIPSSADTQEEKKEEKKEEKEEKKERKEKKENKIVHWDVENSSLVVCVDVDYLTFACECIGRYDAYLLALIADILRPPEDTQNEQIKNFIKLPTHLLVNSWKMVHKRAAHALRVYRDACKWRITKEKYQWYLTLLTSGSVEAVDDTLADLDTELWHAHFNKKDQVSRKRLEKLLVALLGHSDRHVRNKVAVLLNCFYDHHDWQKTMPFNPTIRCVDDPFYLEIVIDDEANPRVQPEGPQNIFVILVAPSFFKEAKFEVYSYHSFVWICDDEGDFEEEKKDEKIPQKEGETGGGGGGGEQEKKKEESGENRKKYRWRGCIDFGCFKRCGFYDWRVVRANENDGSWMAVHATLAELRRSSSFSLGIRIGTLGGDNKEILSSKENAKLRNIVTASSPVPSVSMPHATSPSINTLPIFTKGGGEEEWAATGDITTTFPLQGRWIVQPSNINNEQLHEVFIDQHDARWDSETGELTQRGNLSSVAASLKRLRDCGITSVYLMGALARDNGDILYTNHGDLTYERPDASPFAVTCRATPNEMLGGVVGFLDLMKEAKRLGIKIIIDSLSRISSSRPHRKYWPLILHTLDEQGKKIMLYGTDGKSLSYEDSSMLNYRKVEAWDLLISDLKAWAVRMGVDGARLDNAQAWPQILHADEKELGRVDADGQSHYCPDDKLMGEVVVPFTESSCGFWDTAAAKSYANPFIVKLCKELWLEVPQFMIIGECWGGRGLEGRPAALVKSGVIPQLQQLPYTLCKIFARQINQDACVESLPKAESVLVLKEWFDACHEDLSDGAVLVQSSCSHSSPLPGLLYGRGAWPAIDLLFLLPDIPSTFAGEMEGMAFRLDVANVYQTSEIIRHKNEGILKNSKSSAISLVNLNENDVHTPSSAIRRGATHSNASGGGSSNRQGLLTRVRSLSKFESVTNLPALEEEHLRELGPEYGFDLKRIKGHYDHRRMLRHKFRVFTRGKLAPLKAMQVDGSWLPLVLAFLRVDTESFEFAMVAINFSSSSIENVCVSLRILSRYFDSFGLSDNRIFECRNLFRTKLDGTYDGPCELFSLAEVACEPQMLTLQPYSSVCKGFSLVNMQELPPHRDVTEELYHSSLDRLEEILRKAKALNMLAAADQAKPSPSLKSVLVNNYVFHSLLNAIQRDSPLDEFADVLERLHCVLQKRRNASSPSSSSSPASLSASSTSSPSSAEQKKNAFSLLDLCVDSGLFAESDELGAMLIAKMQLLVNGHDTSKSPPGCVQFASGVIRDNCLGPLVFVTPELGRWSTVGGLGVMVDELSCTLAQDLGQEVWVISPYYDKNRKEEVDYMSRDVTHSFNITLQVASESITLGVHEGSVKGVRLFFVHNAKYFPHPYPDMFGWDAVKFLVVIAKSALEVLCHIRVIPQLIITNDWPTSLIPAYAKGGHFGDVFNNTTFYHIIHNLDPSYEGRIYSNKREDISWIHQLPSDLLVDPNWQQYVINPSRCVLLQCDAWGTVSPSYRDDLCGHSPGHTPSPLAPLLNRYPSPFAYPNGIPIESREARLRSTGCANHIEAKSKLQMRYFAFKEPDPRIPLFAFIGRITAQKGVHLILEATENIIRRYESRVQILVGGRASWSDPYSVRCAQKMWELRDKYPWSFWADPNEFFVDGPLVNLGADFGLMPSAFEPGGIVQHEFFIAGTPVIAYRTGGLKDTVFEFNLESHTGNGFTFEAYHLGDLLYAMERAIRLFNDSGKYAILRKNARGSVVSCEQVARAWLAEFCRLRRKLAVNTDKVKALLRVLPPWDEAAWLSKAAAKRVKGDVDTSALYDGKVSAQRGGGLASPSPSVTPRPTSPSPQQISIIGGGGGTDVVSGRKIILPTQMGPIPTSPPILDAAGNPPGAVGGGVGGGMVSGPPSKREWSPGLTSSSNQMYFGAGGANQRPSDIPSSTTAPSAGGVGASLHETQNAMDIQRPRAVTNMQLIPCRLKYVPPGGRSRPRTVAIAGSFDDWRVRRPLAWDNALQAFTISLALQPGKYLYKLIVNGDWICNVDEPTEKDSVGNVNNVLLVS